VITDSPLSQAGLEGPVISPQAPPARVAGGFRRLTDVIVDMGFATLVQIEEILPAAREAGVSAEQLMVDRGLITAEQRGLAIAERLGLEFVDLSSQRIDLAAVNLLSGDIAKRLDVVPIGREDGHTLVVAMADPTNVVAIDDVEIHTGFGVRAVVATPEDIHAVLANATRLDGAVSQVIEQDAADAASEELGISDRAELQEAASETPVVKLVNQLLSQAVAQGASDIHFDAGASEMRVRLRVDGVLVEVARVPARMVPALVSRMKIMCELDISERRLPQDGRLGLTVAGRPIDIRAVTIPTVHGESVVMRLLDRSAALIDLDRLGLETSARARLDEAIGLAHGSVLVTGPTGSGKSTTLYAIINQLNAPDRNIVTIEDPVEYQLDGITQMPINVRQGLTFAAGLRSMMRADPDIIMVGEIRDHETAQISIEAALTGHLLFSTLHTNDAPSAITRLVEMGIEPFLVASSIRCVIAQRLTRTLCTSCRRPVTLRADALRHAGFDCEHDIEAFEAGGCARCGGTGYRGRAGIYEIMPISPAIRQHALDRAASDTIAATARDEGMHSLRDDALRKVREGLTAVEEVVRVLGT
jgi:type IV pilus assembly protein PilB